MKQNLVPGIVLMVALAACGAGWLILPSLQDAQRTVDAEAAVHLERARRLLDAYNHTLTYKSLLLEPLRESDVDVDVEDPDELIGVVEETYHAEHERLWNAYQPYDYDYRHPAPPRKARASYANAARDVRDGVQARDRLIEDNENLLDEALEAVQQALSVKAADVSSASYSEANRLKGIILHHMGIARRLSAEVLRSQADTYRRKLVVLGACVREAVPGETVVADSGIIGQIGRLQALAAKAEAKLTERRSALDQADGTIGVLEGRLSAARTRRDQACQALETILRAGIDFSAPDAAGAFETRLLEQDRIFREVGREAKSLEYGTYPNARIEGGGDYLTGRYVEDGAATDLTIEYGLLHYHHERAVLLAGLNEDEQALDDLRSDIARLEGIKNSYEGDHARALQQADQARAQASEAYNELNRVDSEAFVVEQEALDLFEQSVKASQRGVTSARQWITDARDATQGLSQEAKERSGYGERLRDDWLGGHIGAQVADAHLAKAWILHHRYHAYTQNTKILTDLAGPLRLTEADRDAEAEKASEAHDQGVEAISQAMGALEQAYRDCGRHWAFVAQQAGAYHLLALFGHPEYLDDAIQAYDNVVEGREDRKLTEKFAALRDQLERSKSR